MPLLNALELIAHSRQLIADFKFHRSTEFHEAPLPLSGAGKILKVGVRKPCWATMERQVR